MIPMTINGMKITFVERPKHRAVVAVRDIMTSEILKLIDVSDLDGSKSVEEALTEKVMSNPDIASKLSELQAEMEIDQTIILGTDLDYSTLQELKDDMYSDDFIELFNKAKEVMGGKTAEDFFNAYPTNINSRKKDMMLKKAMQEKD